MQLMFFGIMLRTNSSSSRLAAMLEFALQFVGLVEVVLDGALGTAGDEDHVGDAGGHRLLDRILDQRLVHDGHHFLRAGLGCRQETGAQAGDGKHRFGDFLHRHVFNNSLN
jgi:hypothetical protein